MNTIKRVLIALSVLAVAAASPARAESFDKAIAAAADAWLAAMADKAKDGRFKFTDSERFEWHYVPRSRDGAVIREMTPAQRAATKELMRSTLSARGVLKAEAVMALEAVLAGIEGSSLSYRDPEKYYISVFGAPGTYPWGWRLEGHHLSINVTVAAAGEVSVTPTFVGSNPARVPSGPKQGSWMQYDEFILALRLAGSLDAKQRAQALLGNRSLGEVIAGPGRGEALEKPEGLPVGDLNPAQRKLLGELIAAYIGLARDEIGRPYMDLVREGFAETRFVWAGERKEGEAFYYRIHGPRVLIEFDNSQNDANHIHSLWRDPKNDFGRDALHRHYKGAPVAHGHKP
jgi:hypothetical protein